LIHIDLPDSLEQGMTDPLESSTIA